MINCFFLVVDALAYFDGASAMRKKRFITLTPRTGFEKFLSLNNISSLVKYLLIFAANTLRCSMGKLQLTGRYLDPVFNSGRGSVHAMKLCYNEVEQTNLKLKTRPNQLLGYLPLCIEFPGAILLSDNKLG